MTFGWIAVLMSQIKSPNKWMWLGVILVFLSIMFHFGEKENKKNLNYRSYGEEGILKWGLGIVGVALLVHHFFF
jgi:hypothetical protein